MLQVHLYRSQYLALILKGMDHNWNPCLPTAIPNQQHNHQHFQYLQDSLVYLLKADLVAFHILLLFHNYHFHYHCFQLVIVYCDYQYPCRCQTEFQVEPQALHLWYYQYNDHYHVHHYHDH